MSTLKVVLCQFIFFEWELKTVQRFKVQVQEIQIQTNILFQATSQVLCERLFILN